MGPPNSTRNEDAAGLPVKGRRVCLDIIRGLAALEVAAGHLRNFMFAGADKGSSVFWKAFMIVTGQAHSAVVIFFVLSGYLIGQHVFDRFRRGRWSWREYAIHRLTRLWIVLVPALVLTLILDKIGLHLLHASLYQGELDPAVFGSIPTASEMVVNHSAATFLGNLLFLQNGILVAAYGVNAPLWSLANEFWYYLLFPLAFAALGYGGRMPTRLAYGVLALAICLALPLHVLVYGLIWLLGALVAAVQRLHGWTLPTSPRVAGMLSVLVVVSFYVIPRYLGLGGVAADFATALLFAALIYCVSAIDLREGVAVRALTLLADMSFTLYLTHFPFFALVLAAIDDNQKFAPSAAAILAYLAILCASLVYALAVYWLCERRTRRLQDRLCGVAA